MYQPHRAPRVESVPIRTLRYQTRVWPAERPDGKAPPLVLLHGWMDVGASWQFVVDAFDAPFAAARTIIAPDWRGFGGTRPPTRCDHYVFADYLADLDQLLDHYAGDRPVDLVGHSMGGNVAMAYAGARPARIRRLVNLEGFGLPATQPAQAPARYAQWMEQLRQYERGEMDLKTYASADDVAARLRKTNPRISADKAAWLARQWAAQQPDGRWAIQGDAAHKIVNPQLYRVDEALALHAAITAPLLSVHAAGDSASGWWQGRYSLAEYHERLRHVPDARSAEVQDAGHMLHHDQPQAVARLIEDFVLA
ncbi:Pimeloyl-ACP methyl ester carboxylesterase [Oryzisolibacter propanilivorax]|uniref:Pimeloyl-ACP methyl ester carboxylesterase n=1 Tax=Oryzisolibacter propanilivorax TaxID=1527607 RepID=A0A1G9SNZ6_9BURK|nr:alpha/beta hydrolase [Oryzisolibacter propanilivorax]SDM37233.1 Pimeloyl-ACP methyl ester carboxylesterase [Oryzisolibacter propanilivorax]